MSKRDEPVAAAGGIPADLVAALNVHSEAVVLFHSSVAQSMGLDPTAYQALFLLNRPGPSQRGRDREGDRTGDGFGDLIEATVARSGFGVPNPSLARLCERYDAQQLELIADFLGRNAQRLRDDLARTHA